MSGQVSRVNGPLVEIADADGLAMADVVHLGDRELAAEILAIEGSRATAQAYEYTGGLAPGAAATGTGRPLSVALGPWLLGGIFDGLLRPLDRAEPWLRSTRTDAPPAGTWLFSPVVSVGDRIRPGDCVGRIATDAALEHLALVPPRVEGVIDWVAPQSAVSADDHLASVDGQPVAVTERWPVRVPRPYARRCDLARPLPTGVRALDLLVPIAQGSSAAVPGGFGTGKTILLQEIAKRCTADVIVYVGCGERGNEMAEVVADLATVPDPRTGGRLADRTVVVANTSNMPTMAREASIYTGVTVAELYRDMGYDAVVIADSTSRWAEALRELSSRQGQLPTEEGFPPTLHSALAAFYERAGSVETLGGRNGTVTVIGAVSPPSGDLAEPVTSHTQQLVRGLWSLDRDRAYAREHPALSWSGSFSRDVAAIADWRTRTANDSTWSSRRERILTLIAEADRLSALADLLGITALAGRERATVLAARLLRTGVLQQSSLDEEDAACTPRKATALADALLAVGEACLSCADAGVDPALLEAVDFGPLVRARTEAAADDVAAVDERRAAVLALLPAPP